MTMVSNLQHKVQSHIISRSHTWTKIIYVEKLVANAVALSFFSNQINLGRWLILATSIFVPRHSLLGVFGVLMSHVASESICKNDTLKQSGTFRLNGWFLGLAIATFYSSNQMACILLAGLSFISSLVVLLLDRFLRNWDLPQLVLPYLVTVWFIQLLSMYKPSLKFSLEPILEVPFQNHIVTIILGSLNGFGQIFLQKNLLFSAAIFIILAKFRVMNIWMSIAAPIASTAITYIIAGPHWAVTSGLTSFTAILMTAAYQAKFISPTPIQLMFLILISGLLELIALQLVVVFNIFALSSAYVAVIWIAKMITETSRATGREILHPPW